MARPFHFTVDPLSPATFSTFHFSGATATWSQSGTEESATSTALSEEWIIRDTDTENEGDCECLLKTVLGGANRSQFGPMINYIDSNNFYLAHCRAAPQSDLRLMKRSGGTFTVETSKSFTWDTDRYYRVRMTSADNGSNKDLEIFVDGVSELSATSSVQHGAGGAAWIVNLQSSSATCRCDWFAFNLNPTVSSVSPVSGSVLGGTAVTLTGTDYGEGMLVDFGSNAATSVVVTPETSIACVTPALPTGSVDVTAKFGTVGSEEYSGALSLGYEYTGVGSRFTGSVYGVKLNI